MNDRCGSFTLLFVQAYTQSLEQQPEFTKALVHRGTAHLKLKRFLLAVQVCFRLFFDTLNVPFIRPLSLKDLENATKQVPDDEVALYRLGFVFTSSIG